MRGPLLLTLLLAAAPARGEVGLTAAAFLKRAMGARAAAMGGAHAGVVDPGPEAAQYNPAGLARLERPALATSYLNGFGGVTHGNLAYAHPTRLGVFGAGLLYFNAGDIGLNLSDGTKRTVTAEEDMSWTLSYAAKLPWGLAAGATYRFLRMDLAETAHAVSHQGDLGAHWRTPLKGLSFGAAYQYLGKDIVFEEAGDPPPKTFRYGAALRFPEVDASKLDDSVDLEAFDMTLAGDVVQALKEQPSQRAGIELGLTPALMTRVALRFGWVFGRFAEGLTFGAGFKAGRYALDYGYGATRETKALSNLTFSMTF